MGELLVYRRVCGIMSGFFSMSGLFLISEVSRGCWFVETFVAWFRYDVYKWLLV